MTKPVVFVVTFTTHRSKEPRCSVVIARSLNIVLGLISDGVWFSDATTVTVSPTTCDRVLLTGDLCAGPYEVRVLGYQQNEYGDIRIVCADDLDAKTHPDLHTPFWRQGIYREPPER